MGPVVSDVSAIGSNVWAVVGTCPINSRTVAAACPATVDVSTDDGATWQPTAAAPPVSEEPGLSVADQDLELARITAHQRLRPLFRPGASRRWRPERDNSAIPPTVGGPGLPRPDPCPTYFDTGQEIAASGTNDLWMVCALASRASGSQAKALYRSSDGGRHWALTAAANAPVLSGNVSLPAGGGLPVGGYVSPIPSGHENLAVLTPRTRPGCSRTGPGCSQTIDGGRTWTPVSGLARAGLVGGGSGNVVFVDATHGWVCEVGAGLWRTTDGVHWEHLGP